jgi:hypothetical protein
MGIPGYPSFKASIYFFFKNLVNFSSSKKSSNIGLVIFLLSFLSALILPCLKIKLCLKAVIYVFVAALTAYGFYLVPVAMPVYLMILFSGLMLHFLLDENSKKMLTLSQSCLSFVVLLVLCSVLSFNTFSPKKLNIKENVDNYFSKGTVLSVSNTSSWLIWSDEEVHFWAYCRDMRSYIYGTKGMENVFIKIQMGDDISPIFCPPI